MFVILIIRVILIIATIYVAFFSLWRTFEREHLDDIQQVLDRVIIAAVLSWYFSRIPSGVDMIINHTIQPLTLLSPLVASASWQVGIIIFCTSLYFLLPTNWRDRYAVLDFTVVAIPVFLSGFFLWQIVTLLVSSLLRSAAIPWGYLVTMLLGILYFFGFSRLLAYFERQYRAYFWYRYRRSSAQSGFVTSTFLIGVGFFGLLHNLHQIPYGIVSLSMFFTVWSLFTMVGGFILLYIRSGRLKKK